MESLEAAISERIEMIYRGEVPEGYKKTKVGIIPEDWEVKRLRDVIESSQYGTSQSVNDKRGYPVLRMGNLKNGRIDIDDLVYIELSKKEFRQLKLKKDDLLINRTNSYELVGKTSLFELDGEYVFASYIVRFRLKEDIVNPRFANYYMNLERTQRHLKTLATKGVQQANLNPTVLKRFLMILLPISINEQQKIARILSTWDEAIELKEKLIEEKKEQKKGLMQNLLTGEVRLPGFDGEWEEVRLRELGEFFRGKGIPRSNVLTKGIGCVTYGEIYTTYNYTFKNCKSYINEKTAENSFPIKKNDILFAGSGETLKEIGKCVAYLGEDEAFAGGDIIVFRPYDIDGELLGYLLNHDIVNRQKYKLGQGHSVVHIYAKDLGTIVIPVLQKKEQKAIAQILSTSDKEIELLEEELELLKLQKKGLMQLLLTGMIRVKCYKR